MQTCCSCGLIDSVVLHQRIDLAEVDMVTLPKVDMVTLPEVDMVTLPEVKSNRISPKVLASVSFLQGNIQVLPLHWWLR